MDTIRRNKALYLAILGFFIVLLAVFIVLGFKRFLISGGADEFIDTEIRYETINVAYKTDDICGNANNCTKSEKIELGEKDLNIYFSKNGASTTLKAGGLEFNGNDFEIKEFGILGSKYFVILVKTDVLSAYYYNIGSMSLFKKVENVSGDYKVLDKSYDYYTCRKDENANNVKDTYNMSIDNLGNLSQRFVKTENGYCNVN